VPSANCQVLTAHKYVRDRGRNIGLRRLEQVVQPGTDLGSQVILEDTLLNKAVLKLYIRL
jgi:hypothetical protein